MKERVYISGRMSGLTEKEYTAHFSNAERELKAKGYKVCNPCRYGWLMKRLPYKVALALDLLLMCRCQRAYFLGGWTESNGASVEHRFACVTGMIIEHER